MCRGILLLGIVFGDFCSFSIWKLIYLYLLGMIKNGFKGYGG